ncbi:chemokine-like receptor 1 [Platysternon megacephalum]|uniref:Chemokine-like receptor 1 n=1 Tax=Platysternon megacephalum TaxID=55544 RepID=A0A4D9DLA0_9SAUR|nr:chemokine-like receptor 1 [Platysternon megacephalum]
MLEEFTPGGDSGRGLIPGGDGGPDPRRGTTAWSGGWGTHPGTQPSPEDVGGSVACTGVPHSPSPPPRMASGRARSTRKLRQWTVEQVESGRFPGLVWDDPPAKTMFRIPWKHAGKQDFRHDEDAAFFKVHATETLRTR